MGDISCLVENEGCDRASIVQFLAKLPQLEQQIALCLGSQSLLHQVSAKCNRLEGQLKDLRKEFDKQLRKNVLVVAGSLVGTDATEVAKESDSEAKEEPNQNISGVAPNLVTFKCKFCPISARQKNFECAKSLAEHYTAFHRLPGLQQHEKLPAAASPGHHCENFDQKDLEPDHKAPQSNVKGDAMAVVLARDSGKRCHRCLHCGIVCCSATNLKRHITSMHQAPTVACISCGKWFHRLDRLKLHQCGVQPKVNVKKRGVKVGRQIQGHTLEDRTCPEAKCGKVFVNRFGMQRHRVSVHTEEPRFTCEFCGDKLRRKDTLKLHLKRRHNRHDSRSLRKNMDELTAGGPNDEGRETTPTPEKVDMVEGFRMDLDYLGMNI